jgi:putative chitinase
MITKSLLVDSKTCSEDMADKWIDALNQVCEKYEINTALRIAGFLSQCGHESGGFRYTVENFNYSAARLLMVFPHYFNADSAKNYEYKPEKIANRVYANRMGNEDEASGDGWQYRGRGLIQLTGKDSYAAFSMAADNNSLVEPDLLEQPELAAMSAGWYWSTRKINSLADAQDVLGMTKRINGGTNGLDDRQIRYSRLIEYYSK